MFESLDASVGSADALAQRLGPDLEEGILAFVVLGFDRWKSRRFHSYGNHENDFTAALVGCLREIRRERGLPYLALREHVQDSPEILAGDADPARAVRIDITVWWDHLSDDAYYSIECKRLAPGRLTAEYVAQGIMRYAGSRYAADKRAASMAAYLIEGDVSPLVSEVNSRIAAQAELGAEGRLAERQPIGHLSSVFGSRHRRRNPSSDITLTHLWFDVREREREDLRSASARLR